MEAMMIHIQPFFDWLLRTTLVASVVACLILAIQKTLGGKLGPRWCYALWVVLLIRMVLPWAPSSRFSLFNLIPSWGRQASLQQSVTVAQQKPSEAAQTPEAAESMRAQKPEPDVTAQAPTATRPVTVAEQQSVSKQYATSLRHILPALWLAGAIVIGAYLIVSDLALWRIVKRDRPLVNQSLLELFEECKAQMGIQSLVVVVPSERVRSPGLFGFVRPRLLLPRQMLDTATRQELRYIFLHELAHLKRYDIYLGWLASLLQVLHWFNPLVWFAFYRMRADRELACDALVLTRTGQDKSQEYGGTILGLVRRFSQPRRLPAMAGVIESKSQLKKRIAMITQFKHNSYRLSVTGISLIAVLGAICLPDAEHTKAAVTQASAPAEQPKFTKINVPTKLPIKGSGVLSPDGQTLASIAEGSVWVVPVHGKSSPEISGTPVRLTESMHAWDVANVSIAWSGNGKWIGFRVAAPSEKKNAEEELYIVSAEGGTPKRLPITWKDWAINVHTLRYALSANAETLYFTEGPKLEQTCIYSMSADGSNKRQITEPITRDPAVSPDGSKIAYVRINPGPDNIPMMQEVWVKPLDGGEPVLACKATGKTWFNSPIWSPDSNRIAFLSSGDRGGNRFHQVWIVALSPDGIPGSPTKFELPAQTSNLLAGWTQDNKIGILVPSEQEVALFTVPASGGKATQLTTEYTCMPVWAPDNKVIFFDGCHGGKYANLEFVAAEGGTVKRISVLPENLQPAFPSELEISNDGSTLLFAGFYRFGEPKPEGRIFTVPIEGGMVTPLRIDAEEPLHSVLCPKWSPDEARIAFLAAEPIKPDLYALNIFVMPASGGKPQRISSAEDKVSRATIEWSPDGELIAFYGQDNTLRLIPSDGGTSRTLTSDVGGGLPWAGIAWSPDGKQVAYTAGGDLHVVSRDGGQPSDIKTDLDARHLKIDWSRDGKHIAFTASRGGDPELWLMENFLPAAAIAGPEPTMTVRKIGGDWGTFASLSPDGRYLCDVDWNTENLAAIELATGKTQRLTKKSSDSTCHPLESAISPDSRKVAYLWFDNKTRDSSVRIAGLDGSGDRLLCEGKHAMPRAWSADGKKILAVVSETGAQQMVWISALDGSIQNVASFDNESLGYPGTFDISPDGRFVVYDRLQAENASQRDIFAFDLIDNRELSIVEHPSDDKLLGWTPDGKHVLFASNRTGIWDAWLLQVAGGKPRGSPRMIKQDMGDIRPIGFTPDGSYYYAQERVLQDVFIAKLDLETGVVLSEPVPVRQTGATACHDWSPDGRYLAYCERRPDESQVIRIRTLATGRERTLADNIPDIRWLRWALDGRSILIDGARTGDSQGVIFKIDVQTSNRSELVRSETEVLIRPEMSPDGRTLYFARNNPKSRTTFLVARDLQSGQERELLSIDPPARLTGSALSPDGQQLVLSIVPNRTGTDAPVLELVSTAGGSPRTLLQFTESERLRTVGVTWMPDSSNVVFWKWFQGFKDLELWRVSADGGEPRRLWSRKALGHMRVNPDGRHVAFYDRTTARGVWVMENFLPATAVAESGR